ncbi:hypothetical protein E4U31_001525 [Claviceps sp. LM219 group G6]|nr:hypothetical protein E4U31_001525 [Claviceps sp. LM219 group G6]
MRHLRHNQKKHYESFVKKLVKDCDDGTFCDLEIDCGERRFRAHRNVICLHSPVIRAAFFGKWKTEPTCGVFEIKEYSHMLVRRMLDYIYTGDYDDFDSSTLVHKDHLSPGDVAKLEILGHVPLHADMMELGETYLVEGLSQLTSYKFTKLLTSLFTSTVIVDIIPKVYALNSGPSDVFRKSVIDDMRERLLRRSLAADMEELLEDVMRDVPQFTHDLLKSYLYTPRGGVQMFNTPFSFSRSGRYTGDASGAQEHYHNFVRKIENNPVAHVQSQEAARGVFEIKEASHMLVRRMLDYIYTGDYDDFDSSTLVQKDHFSSREAAQLDIADYLTLHIEMMKLGDMYMVDGLSLLTSKKLAEHLASQKARDILVSIIPKIYAFKIDLSDTIRKIAIDCMRKKLLQLPLADDVEESLKDVAEKVPEFTCELLKSYMVALARDGNYEDSRMYQESEDFECTSDYDFSQGI